MEVFIFKVVVSADASVVDEDVDLWLPAEAVLRGLDNCRCCLLGLAEVCLDGERLYTVLAGQLGA